MIMDLEARELDEDEFEDEKLRLQHENETRNYKLWSRGATFDYIRYGVVEDKKERPLILKSAPHKKKITIQIDMAWLRIKMTGLHNEPYVISILGHTDL